MWLTSAITLAAVAFGSGFNVGRIVTFVVLCALGGSYLHGWALGKPVLVRRGFVRPQDPEYPSVPVFGLLLWLLSFSVPAAVFLGS